MAGHDTRRRRQPGASGTGADDGRCALLASPRRALRLSVLGRLRGVPVLLPAAVRGCCTARALNPGQRRLQARHALRHPCPPTCVLLDGAVAPHAAPVPGACWRAERAIPVHGSARDVGRQHLLRAGGHDRKPMGLRVFRAGIRRDPGGAAAGRVLGAGRGVERPRGPLSLLRASHAVHAVRGIRDRGRRRCCGDAPPAAREGVADLRDRRRLDPPHVLVDRATRRVLAVQLRSPRRLGIESLLHFYPGGRGRLRLGARRVHRQRLRNRSS